MCWNGTNSSGGQASMMARLSRRSGCMNSSGPWIRMQPISRLPTDGTSWLKSSARKRLRDADGIPLLAPTPYELLVRACGPDQPLRVSGALLQRTAGLVLERGFQELGIRFAGVLAAAPGLPGAGAAAVVR